MGAKRVSKQGVTVSTGNAIEVTNTTGSVLFSVDSTGSLNTLPNLTAKGSILTASATSTPTTLAVGTNEHRLVVDSATTSGLKYVADTTNYAVGAKGDLLVGTAADTVTNLAVASTAGYLLTVDSGETTGLKWAAPATPAFVGAYAYRNNSNLSVPATTDTVITLPDEAFDTNSFHSTSTNTGRITIPTGYGGKYLVQAHTQMTATSAGYVTLRIYKNGAAIADGYSSGQISRVFASSSDIHSGSLIINLAANDYIEMVMFNEFALTCNFAVLSVEYLGA